MQLPADLCTTSSLSQIHLLITVKKSSIEMMSLFKKTSFFIIITANSKLETYKIHLFFD